MAFTVDSNQEIIIALPAGSYALTLKSTKARWVSLLMAAARNKIKHWRGRFTKHRGTFVNTEL